MNIRIYNTLSRKKERLEPLEEGHVRLYVCGITSYDYCHIGHARSALVFDMVVRYLRHRGMKVTFVRNFTDIDDKIIRRAQERGEEAQALAQRFIDEFYTDMDRLGVLRPDIEPRATEHIPEMIALVEELMARDLAYESGGDVFFAVDRFPGYGRLSGRRLEDMQAGARISVDSRKRHPMDFVLWKAAKPGEPSWDSPWGPGRPGWHIECSAMSRRYLGETFDIHGGGQDLVFPHHENEIAQSEGANGRQFARLWIHHGFVTIRDEKMSKSLGNFLTIREVLEAWHPEVLRLFIFSTQYRKPLDFSESALGDAESALERLYACLHGLETLPPASPQAEPAASKKDRKAISGMVQRFETAMDNDFNTPQALAALFDGAKAMNRLAGKLGPAAAPADLDLLARGAGDMRELAGVMGLLGEEPAAFLQARREARLAGLDIGEEEIERLIEERRLARERKDWAAGDAIRDRLLEHGIVLEDGPGGTTWSVKG